MNAEDAKGRAAARRLCQWELGSPEWADRIINAYLNPDHTNRWLDYEQDDEPSEQVQTNGRKP